MQPRSAPDGRRVGQASHRELALRAADLWETRLRQESSRLRLSLIHNDANDYNLLATGGPPNSPQLTGLIDFGDMLETLLVAEPAIAAAYAIMSTADPAQAAAELCGGFHQAFPLREAEVAVFFAAVAARLALSGVMAARQRADAPENAYLSISEAPAWEALRQWLALSETWVTSVVRHACGWEPAPRSQRLRHWLAQQSPTGPLLRGMASDMGVVLDLRPDADEPASAVLHPPDAWKGFLEQHWKTPSGGGFGIGRYDEPRRCYASGNFRDPAQEVDLQRTIHLGLDLFAEAGVEVLAPLDGWIQSVADNAGPLDYGPTLILRHHDDQGEPFYTLYGHLQRGSVQHWEPGQAVTRGQVLARLGEPHENGGWPPHLHFQIILDLLNRDGDFPGVGCTRRRQVWLSLCPDPNLLLGLPAACRSPREDDTGLLHRRQACMSPSLSLSYTRPLHIVRGERQYLFDSSGRQYLDCVNNVALVGHSHPEITAALVRQAARLNTNTRYLHENMVQFAEALIARLPSSLDTCFFVNSGSEANDLAWRLARAWSGGRGAVVLEGAYHGHISSLIDLSPYKFQGPGGAGAPAYVKTAAAPDVYRRGLDASDPNLGVQLAQDVELAFSQLQAQGETPAVFFCESMLGCGGQIDPPGGYLAAAYQAACAAGALCVADEVQTGFGRVGESFWAFVEHQVVPDILTLGKPIGNGHPLAAVVTTREIAARFANGMEYFNTFGGNPVSCAVGLEVLHILDREGLPAHARACGERLLVQWRELAQHHPCIGDVRGRGMFLGIELVTDRQRRTPAARHARFVVERLRDHGVLLSTDGPHHNVIKFKPPLPFSVSDGDRVTELLDKILRELSVVTRD